MTLQKQIIEILLKRNRPFYIFTRDTHPIFQPELYLVKPCDQTSYDTKLLATLNKEYRPSARLVSLEDMYDPSLIKKTRFDSEEEKEAEIDRILKASGFTNSMSNRKSKGEEVESYFKLIEEKRQEELDFKRNGPKVYPILLDDVKQIRIAHEKELVLVWSFYADEKRERLDSFSDLSNVDDEMLIERYKMDNPATLEDNILNCITKIGKDKFLTDLIPSFPQEHKKIIDSFIEEQDSYSFLKKIGALMDVENRRKIDTALDLKSKFSHEFYVHYEKAMMMNAISSSSGRLPRIECGPIYKNRGWAGAMANNGRIIDVDNKLVFRQPMTKIEEIIKPMMIEHYHKARGNYKKELYSYVFYDFCGNKTRFSLEDLGLPKEEADE